MSQHGLLKFLVPALPFLLLATVSSYSQEQRFLTPAKLFSSGQITADELMPVVPADGKTLYFVRAFCADNMGGVSGGHDIWYATITDAGRWSEPQHMQAPLNNKRENAVVGISRDGLTLYLLNEYKSKKKMKTGISRSTMVDGKWSDPEAMKIPNLVSKSYFHGFYVHADERILLLSAEGEYTQGKEDIYLCLKNDSTGSWSPPINLGEQINTSGSEVSPFLSLDTKTLYFSSEGHGGLGSFDMFYSRRQGDSWSEWSEPVNLGDQINSSGFDAYMALLPDSAVLFSSDREGGLSALFVSRMLGDEDLPDMEHGGYYSRYEFEKRVEQKVLALYQIDQNGSRLNKAEIDYDGYFVFRTLPPSENHLFTLEGGGDFDVNRLKSLEILLTDRRGVQRNVILEKDNNNRFIYEAPEKQAPMLYLLSRNDTLMNAALNEDGFFVFYPLPFQEDYVFRLEAGDDYLLMTKSLKTVFRGKPGATVNLEINKVSENLFMFEPLPLKEDVLYLISGSDTLMQTTRNGQGIFAFYELPFETGYTFALSESNLDHAAMLPVEFIDDKGQKKEVKVQNIRGSLYRYVTLPGKETVLYLISNGDTLTSTARNADGVFVFGTIPYDINYRFLLEGGEMDMLEELPIEFTEGQGTKMMTTITKSPVTPFIYEYLPGKQTMLYVIEGTDTVMMIAQNQKGIFDFRQLPYLENYVFALETGNTAMIDEIPIRYKNAAGKETLTTITKKANEPFVYEYLPGKQTMLYVIEGTDTVMMIAQNQKGIFDFRQLPYLDSYVFALDATDAGLIEELNIKLSTSTGRDTVITAARNFSKPNSYKSLASPDKQPGPAVDAPLIYFEFNSGILTDKGKQSLAPVIERLKKNPGETINLEGYADSKGSAEYNQKLSILRTQSVFLYLVHEGIAIDRISVYYFGEANPIAPNVNQDGSDNAEGRKLNRRVAVTFHSPDEAGQSNDRRINTADLLADEPAVPAPAEPVRGVAEASTCKSVSDRQPVGISGVFASDVGKVWFFTKLEGMGSTFVTHVWYYGDKEMARVKLPVNGAKWRTFSSKNIYPTWKGDWKVEVISEDNQVLKSAVFRIE